MPLPDRAERADVFDLLSALLSPSKVMTWDAIREMGLEQALCICMDAPPWVRCQGTDPPWWDLTIAGIAAHDLMAPRFTSETGDGRTRGKPGRPPTYSPDIGKYVLYRLNEGASQKQVRGECVKIWGPESVPSQQGRSWGNWVSRLKENGT